MSLRADGIGVVRDERVVFRDVSLTLAPGGAVVVTGENGAGKSTFLRVLAGLRAPDAGAVLWDGAAIERTAHGARVAYLGHQDGLRPTDTVADAASRDAVALATMALGRLAGQGVRDLSAGQRRRAALARVVASGRPLWLLDEPAGALDAASLDRLRAAIAAHRAAGGMLVAVTHQALGIEAATLGL